MKRGTTRAIKKAGATKEEKKLQEEIMKAMKTGDEGGSTMEEVERRVAKKVKKDKIKRAFW